MRFIECSGNGGRAYRRDPIAPDLTPQQIDGLTSTSEWTGVPLSDPVQRGRRVGEGEVVPGRGHGRRGADAQHPDRQGI